MTEQQVGFLYEAARSLRGKNDALDLLRSYYLMRCKAIGNKGQDLPVKQFGPRSVCSHCSIEWSPGGYRTKVAPLRMLKKSARRRIRQSEKGNKKDAVKKINDKMCSNALERICNFCGHTTVIKLLKPASNQKEIKLATQKKITTSKKPTESISVMRQKIPDHKEKKSYVQKQEINIYSNSKSVFTMDPKKNKQPVQEIKTQKKKASRKKDKFAGLCKEAVLASARAKQNPGTQQWRL